MQNVSIKLAAIGAAAMMIAAHVCCCDDNKKIFAIVIHNRDALKDDNLEIFLNDVSIGTINNNSNTHTGRIFSTVPAITPANIDDTRIGLPGANNFEPTIAFPAELLISSASVQNHLKIYTTHNNGSGPSHVNLGFVIVQNFVLDNGRYVPEFEFPVGASSYTFGNVPAGSLVGDYPFTYPIP